MGYYLQIDTQEMQPLASLKGYGDVIRWVGSLPPSESKRLRHLTQFGWQQNVKELADELASLSRIRPPESSDTKATVENFAALLKGNENAVVVSVTDGMG